MASMVFKKGYYSIEDDKGNKTIIYPRTIPECVKIQVEEGKDPKTLQDILNTMKSAAYKDVNELIDPASKISYGTASEERTYNMKAIKTAFQDINKLIESVNETISEINDPTEKVDQLGVKVDTLTNQVDALTNVIDNFNKKLTTIQTNQESISSRISKLENVTRNI